VFKNLFDLKPSEYNDKLRVSPVVRVAGLRQQWYVEKQLSIALLRRFQEHKSTEVCDKMYALLGLAVEASRLEVDYRITPDELFRKVELCTVWTDYEQAVIVASTLGSNILMTKRNCVLRTLGHSTGSRLGDWRILLW
jgi:hypothetical protein